MRQTQIRECPAEPLAQVLDAIRRDEAQGLVEVERLLGDYPRDARLHFLKGSLLAGLERYGDARPAMRRAVEIAPDYAIARFQLGLLELTSGDAAAAVETLRPLERLAPDNALRIFAAGLNHLIRDEFQPALEALRDGISRNAENPVLNKDMQMLIDRIEEVRSKPQDGGEAVSAAHLLLQQYTTKSTKH